MPSYKAPLADIRFNLYEMLGIDKRSDLPEFANLDRDTIDAILEGGAKICEDVLAPLNQIGDEHGCVLENGVVRTPPGFKEAYKTLCEGGWNRLSAPEEHGGASLPILLSFTMTEMMFSANQAFAMYPGLTNAAYAALMGTGAKWMRDHIASRMASGEWTGTMCLTEPHCGTDLRLMKTKAVEQPDGTYRMTGTKIFISGGDHDMADNIIHMVIAKIPDENGKLSDDLSTVNFFMVPKFIVSEDGKMGVRNGVSCGAVEKKMGIKGSSTCVMNFDNAVAWRLGPKPEPKAPGAAADKKSSSAGMKGMFGMMNAARIGVGIQGIAIGEVAYQNGVAYARERTAGRALTGKKFPEQSADPIMVHPDVRRMLLSARSFVEGARALAMWNSFLLTEARSGDPARRDDYAGMADLMTPIIKAFFTDMGFEATNAAMQCFGGHGYIRDHGMEQFVRDARINQVYEGANGVQALDLVGRKLMAKGGKNIGAMFKHIGDVIAAHEGNAALAPLATSLKRGFGRLQEGTAWLAENGLKNPDNAGAASVEFLRMFGIVLVGMKWLEMAAVADKRKNGDALNPASFYESKLVLARFWMERMMPDTAALLERMKAGADTIMMLDAANF